jgi:hypothetical protein
MGKLLVGNFDFFDGIGRGEFVDCRESENRLALVNGLTSETPFTARVCFDQCT